MNKVWIVRIVLVVILGVVSELLAFFVRPIIPLDTPDYVTRPSITIATAMIMFMFFMIVKQFNKGFLKHISSRLPKNTDKIIGHWYCRYDPHAPRNFSYTHPVCAMIVFTLSWSCELRVEIQDYVRGNENALVERDSGATVMDVFVEKGDAGTTLVGARAAGLGITKFGLMNELTNNYERFDMETYTKFTIRNTIHHINQNTEAKKIKPEDHLDILKNYKISKRLFTRKPVRKWSFRTKNKGAYIFTPEQRRAIADKLYHNDAI